jgi:hypothetical protein
MIELAFVICLRVAPEVCEERALPPLVEATGMQCMMGAQPMLARWSERHPGFRIASWTCRPLRADRAI